MQVPRSKFPKKKIMIFVGWVAFCNILAIIIALLWFFRYPDQFGSSSGLKLGITIALNVVSMLLLYPMFTMDPLKEFLIPALIWFVVINTFYVLIGLYVLLFPGIIQLAADLWFHWQLKSRAQKDGKKL